MANNRRDLLRLLNAPPNDCRPAMFWLLNGRLTPDGIRGQIQQMADRGCGGFFLHPMADNFRPDDFISGLQPEYLSDEYLEMIRIAVEEADRLGLYAWLYDEGGWPSGDAQGRVLAGHPQYRSQALRVEGEGEIVAEVPFGGRTVPLTLERSEDAVDALNPDATARFIEVTHERYAEAVGEYFGGTIPGIFTDEVRVRGEVGGDRLQWTDGMLDEFERRRGFDLRPWLPALFSEDALGFAPSEHFSEQEIAAVRCEFSELWTDLFEEAYFQPINEWCRERGLIHTGHVGGEDRLPDHRRNFGHFFKTAGALHAPGIDAIWRQIFPAEENFSFPRFASSALARDDGDAPGGRRWRGMTLSESFAVYGYSLTPEQMRWVADYQFVRGINYIAPMALYYDTGGGHWIGTMSHLGEGNPIWDSFSSFTEHCGAVSAAIRESRPVVDVAVYYPIEAAWLGGEAMEAAWESLQQVCDALESRQVAWDFVDAATLAAADISDGCVATPGQLYGTVVVPETPVMPVAALEALESLHESGGRVAFCNDMPHLAADYEGADDLARIRDRLAEDAVEMDERAAEAMGGDDPRGLGPSMTYPLDGFTVAYLGPGGAANFTEDEVAEDACLVVPEEELSRFAELLITVIGRHELQIEGQEPAIGMTSRVAGDVTVHLLHNESDEEIEPGLMLVNEEPRSVELCDTLMGERYVIAVHEEVNEPTYFTLELSPGEAALIVTVPLDRGAEAAGRASLFSISAEVRAQGVEVVREFTITEAGDLEIREASYVPDATPADFAMRPLEELGMEHFAGTVRYRVDVYVPPGDVAGRLFLDLGEVGCVARAWLNGEELGESAWPPHLAEITGWAEAGINELTVEVTTTLANQAAREDVVAMAEDRGWLNSYYERTLPWMREGTRSGLIGPVEVLREDR